MFRRGIRSIAIATGFAMIAAAAAAQDEPGAPTEDGAAPAEEAAPAAEPRREAPKKWWEEEGADTSSLAQSSAQGEPPLETIPVPQVPEPVADAPTELDSIEVTAQKRVQRLVDVPINVTAINRDDIQKVRIEQVRDVAGYVPNMDIKEQVPGAMPMVTIRGVGIDDFSSTSNPAAGIYIDQVSLTSLALMSFDLFDVERLEVLKGPQGTLYGRNSNAGAINVITAKPSMTKEGYVRLGYGAYDAKDYEAMGNLPIGDTLALRLAGKIIKQGEGYWESRSGREEDYNGNSASYTENDPVVRRIGRRDVQTGRARLGWEPTTWLSMDLKGEHLNQRSEMGQPEFFGAFSATGNCRPIDPDNCTDLQGYSDTDRDPYVGHYRGDFPYLINQWNQTWTTDIDLGWAALTSTAGHIDFDRFFHIDVDGTPADEFDFFQGDAVEQWTEELRLAGPADWFEDLDLGNWLIGAYYATDTATVNTPGRHSNLLPGNPQLDSHILAEQDTEGYAVFGNVDWKLGWLWQYLEPFSVTTGLRWGTEEKAYAGGTHWTFLGAPCDNCIPNTIDSTYHESSIEDDSVSWKVGLNYAPTRSYLIYANAAEGEKSGGYFSGVTTNDRQLEPYLPETLRAYEVGVKRAGLVAVNASYFWYEYENLQTFMRNASAPVQFMGNVPHAKAQGLDFDVTLRVLDGLTLVGGVGTLEGELGEFTGPNGNNIPAGNKLANSPDMTWNALIRYEVPIFDTGIAAAVQGDGHYSDAAFKEATNDPLIAQGEYTIYNARASVLDAGYAWELAFWGRNITDEQYVVNGVDVSALFIGNRNYNAPKTYGIDFIYRFQ